VSERPIDPIPGPEAHDDPAAMMTVVVGVVSVVLIVVLLLGLEALYNRTVDDENLRKVVDRAPAELTRVRAEQQERLSGYRWIDRQHGVVAIPIDRAIDLVVAEQGTAPGAGGRR
jgi:hypothetical protein